MSVLELARRGLLPDPKIWNKGLRRPIYIDALESGFTIQGNSATVATNVNSGATSGSPNTTGKCVGDFGMSVVANAANGSLQINFPAPINLNDYDYVVLACMSSAAVSFAVRFGAAAGGFCGGYKAISTQNNAWGKFRMFRFHLRQEPATAGATLTSTDPVANQFLLIDLNGAWPTATFYADHVVLVKCRTKMARRGPYWHGSRAGETDILNKPTWNQVANAQWPLIDHASNYWTDALNPNWKVYQDLIDGDFVGTTEQAIEYYARKWGFQKGYKAPTAYKNVKDGLPSRSLPLVGVSYDVPMDYWRAMVDNESFWKIASIGDYRLLTNPPAAVGAAGFFAWTSFGNLQLNRQNWGGYPGTFESVPYSLDAGFANLRHFTDSAWPNGVSTNTYAPVNLANDLDRVRTGVNVYFTGGNPVAEDGTSPPYNGHYVSNLWGGTCYLHGNHDANNRFLNKDWEEATYSDVDFPTF